MLTHRPSNRFKHVSEIMLLLEDVFQVSESAIDALSYGLRHQLFMPPLLLPVQVLRLPPQFDFTTAVATHHEVFVKSIQG